MRFVVTAAIAFFFVAGVAHAGPANRSSSAPAFVQDEVLVKFVPGTPAAEMAQTHGRVGGRVINTLARIGVQQVKLTGIGVEAAIAAYKQNPNVLYAEPNYLRIMDLPDEGAETWPYGGGTLDFMTELWGLNNTGQGVYYDEYSGYRGVLTGAVDADIDFAEAWDWEMMQANPTSDMVKIAVLDSGVDCSHEDLAAKCLLGEQRNFADNSLGDADYIGHGTHVAGTAAASTDNGLGIASPGWNAKIVPVKVCYEELDPLFYVYTGYCADADIAEGLIYAGDQRYDVANMSFAGPTLSETVRQAIEYAWSNNVVLVAGAGNSYTTDPMYPAAALEVIGVGATDRFDNLAYFSSFGQNVSLLAPGNNIFSTYSAEACGQINCYTWLSGTSMATPHVAGAAALVVGRMITNGEPDPPNQEVRDILENSADATGALGQNFLAWSTEGRLNLYQALLAADGQQPTEPPGPDPAGGDGVHVADLDGISINNGGTWTAEVTVTVHDANEALVSGATVSGTWSGGQAKSCQTSGSGSCTVSLPNQLKRVGSVIFTVTGISYGGLPYSSASNHDPDNDSDGTEITVFK